MPGYYKKRRGHQGPNKNEQKVMRARSAENRSLHAGVLGAKFPTIKQLRVRLVFMDTHQGILDDKSLSLGPSDIPSFTVPCPGRCGRGSFDFSERIAETTSARLPMPSWH